jgi:cyclopropane fatty-acyl-phospholipid synthase-like methyltransferase
MECKYDLEKKALAHYDRNFTYFDKNKFLNASMTLMTFKEIKEMLEYFNVELNKNSNILDFGCGTGETSLFLLNEFNMNNLVAIDYSKKRIDNLIERGKVFDNLTALNMDVNYFLEQENQKKKFDTIIAFEIIEHLSNPENVISQLKKLLNKGGKLIGTIPLQDKPNSVHLSAFKSITEIQSKLKVEIFDKFSLRFQNQLVFYYGN